MSTLQPESIVCGPQEFRFIPPDMLQFHLRGNFDGPEVEVHLDFVHRHAAQCGGWVYAIADLTQLERVTESGRQRLTRVETPYPYKACVLLGASFGTRTIANMIVSAGRVLAPQSFHFPIKFVDTYEQAHAWFDELRRNAKQSPRPNAHIHAAAFPGQTYPPQATRFRASRQSNLTPLPASQTLPGKSFSTMENTSLQCGILFARLETCISFRPAAVREVGAPSNT